ncbi:OB-fold domain-containing protein [Phenylobacterium sp.]|uniref:Zn-ribbon domain-containing OB-fold protein n=1 Tax=Phenylobacterium sp. TaxID=1871053 RepID=UPI00286C1316|nr:OB-fold domain-containing protein [Phenylobacterium sp.]
MSQVVAEGVFVQRADGPRMIAGRRKADGEVRFPMPSGPDAALYDAIEITGEGRLWSYTMQRFRPKTPPYIGADDEKTFKPFALGYVEFPGQVIIEGRILVDDIARLKIGQPMRVVIESFPTSSRGELSTYAFEPTT